MPRHFNYHCMSWYPVPEGITSGTSDASRCSEMCAWWDLVQCGRRLYILDYTWYHAPCFGPTVEGCGGLWLLYWSCVTWKETYTQQSASTCRRLFNTSPLHIEVKVWEIIVYYNTILQQSKVGYTLVTLPRIVTPYRDSVDGTRDRVTY